VHIGFKAANPVAVDAFHRAGLAAGGKDNGAPGLRPQYGAHYYAAFILDPDGHNIEAVCQGDVR
jgi:catechol 2,3-dioxygenase-like lactoylglutathione lyase family enzyme